MFKNNQDRVREFFLPNTNMYYEAVIIKVIWNMALVQA